MKWVALISLVVLSLAGIMVWAVSLLLEICRPFDRLLGQSGCVGRIEFAASGLPRPGAMTVPDADGVSSLFGDVETVEGWRPGMIRIDPVTGQECRRFPIRLRNGLGGMLPAAEGEHAMLDCALSQRSTENSRSALVVSLADGTEIQQMDRNRRNAISIFPGDPARGEKFHFEAVFADGGRTVIGLDEEQVLRLYRSDGTAVAVLNHPGDRYNRHSVSLVVSTGGRYALLWDFTFAEARADRFVVWDAPDGRHIQTMELPKSYTISSKPVWMKDESGIFVFSRVSGKSDIDCFAIRATGDEH